MANDHQSGGGPRAPIPFEGDADRISRVAASVGDAASAARQGAGRVVAAAGSADPIREAPDAGHDLVGGAPLPEVDFEFDSEGDPDAAWAVRRAHVREALSELYECTLDLASSDVGADPRALLGAPCVFTLHRAALVRRVCGIARRVEDLGAAGDKRLARVFVAPGLWALSQRVDSRIFQAMTAVEVVTEVLARAGLYADGLSTELQRHYPTREYCVQYRETDLAFVTRLLAEEGIAFHFTHVDDTETLVLSDELSAFPAIATMNGRAVPVAGPAGETLHVESVRHFDWHEEMRSTGVTLRDFDFTHPSAWQDMTRARPRNDPGARAVYDYPARYTLGAYDEGRFAYARHDGARQAEVRADELRTRQAVGAGLGNVTGFAPGTVFELDGHGREGLDGRYVLTRVEHACQAPEELAHTAGEAGNQGLGGACADRYHNLFECIPHDAVFRPARATPRAAVQGPQTATVVGPAGEEIYVDHHGRIKVQFHWDREGRRDAHSSCWIRVAQTWGGAGWGFVFTPRVGMEVLVQFLEGDPDRPLVTGCVYNGEHPAPYPLPDEKTRSTIKTQSSPGGHGFNELRFEDAAGSEEIYVHAQKDYNELVLHDHATRVNRHQTNTIDVNHTESVGGNQSLSVTGNRSKSVTGTESTTVHKTRTETVTGKETLTLQDVRETTIARGDRLTVQTGPHDVIVAAGNDSHTVTGNKTDHVTATYDVTADVTYALHQGGTTLTLTANHAELAAAAFIKLHHGSGVVDVEDGGKIKLTSGTEIELVVGGCNVKLKDGKITVTAPSEITLSVGGAAVKIDPTGVTTSGPKISSTASGIHEISGAMVKIN